MFGIRPNWPVIFFVSLVLSAAALSFASRQGWIKLGRGGCCARFSCSKNQQNCKPSEATPSAETSAAISPVNSN